MSDSTSRKRNAIVAAARPISLDDAKAARAQLSKRQRWQEEAWAYFDEVPEVKFGTLYLGNGMSKVRFYAAVELDDGTRVPIAHESSTADAQLAKTADAEMARLRSALGGQSELNKQAAINWSVAGEFYVHGVEAKPEQGVPGEPSFRPAEPERWDVRSVSEVELSNDRDAQGRPVVKVKSSPEAQGTPIDNDAETLIRMWVRHAQWSNMADCHMRGLIGDCEALVLFNNQQKAEAKSRQAAGVLLVPSELSFTDDTAEQGDDTEQGDQANPFIASLLKALTEPIEDPSSAASVMPLVLSGPAEYLRADVFRLLSFGRTSDATLDTRIEQKVNRIARGLNVPVEVVMGHMSTTFSNAEQIDEDVFRDHFEPLCEALADAWSSGFLIPQLIEGGFAVEQLTNVCVWYDASALVRGQSPEESADELYDRGAISVEAYRRLKGVTDEDAPDDLERIRALAERKGIFTAELTTLLLRKVGVLDPEEVTITDSGISSTDDAADVEQSEQPELTPEEEAAVTAAYLALIAAAREPSSLGRKLFEIDRELRTKLHGAAEAAMARALERAGNRLRSKSPQLSATLRTTPSYRCVATAGPALVASVGANDDELLTGAWDELEQQFKEWSLQAVEATLEALTIELALSPARREELRISYRQNVDEAWGWLAVAMTEQAKVVLYAPERGAVTAAAGVQGEHDPTSRVPVGLLRESIARAGGASGLSGDPGVIDAPMGGIATGVDSSRVLADGGRAMEAYRWVYGPARRDVFEPHHQLDGKVFTNFDDDVLKRRGTWPPTEHYYPGDHKGCVCDFEPIIVEAVESASKSAQKPTDDKRSAGQKAVDDWLREWSGQSGASWTEYGTDESKLEAMRQQFAALPADVKRLLGAHGTQLRITSGKAWDVIPDSVREQMSSSKMGPAGLQGVYIPSHDMIVVSHSDKLGTVMAHEVGHAVDRYIAEGTGRTWWSSSTDAGKLRSLMLSTKPWLGMRGEYYVSNSQEFFAQTFASAVAPDPVAALRESFPVRGLGGSPFDVDGNPLPGGYDAWAQDVLSRFPRVMKLVADLAGEL